MELLVHPGRSCDKCGATSDALLRACNGRWDTLRFCPICEKYFCIHCQVDGGYYEHCPYCNEVLINQA